jgi:hypothetical protein
MRVRAMRTIKDSAELSNALVAQKDYIIRLINDGHITGAATALGVVSDMWNACGYGYKIRELNNRISIALDASNED